MKRNSGTASGSSGITPAGQLALVAFWALRMLACCSDEPDGQHGRCEPRRPPARHAMTTDLLRAASVVRRQRLRRGSSDGLLTHRATCCDARRGTQCGGKGTTIQFPGGGLQTHGCAGGLPMNWVRPVASIVWGTGCVRDH
jgi:hypothetical protein